MDYKNIVNSLPYAVLILNGDLKVRACNKRCETFLSKVAEEILDHDLSEVISHKELQNQAISVLLNGGTKFVELHFNSEHPKILKAVIIALNENNVNKMVSAGENLCLITLEDVSERVKIEEQLVQSEKLAGMGLLAASVTHELGNSLGVISSNLQYIRDDPSIKTNRQLTESIETVMESIGQMHELLRSLSDFTASRRPHFRLTDLRSILFQMLAFIYKEAEAHHIKISHHFDGNLSDCEVDSGDIKQLFLNLLKNAIESMPNGGKIEVRAYLLKGKSEVYVEISDTGSGIRDTDLRSIFRPFYSTKPNGTGLGLPFCKRVVEEHGGEIKVKSLLNKGSTFSVILPIRQEDADANDNESEAQP